MKRRHRVRENQRYQEVRRQGRSFTDKLLVLCALENGLQHPRFGFSVSSRIGKAAVRNRIRRQLREAMRLRLDQVAPGWDLVFIARQPIRTAEYHEMDAACARLLRRAHLFQEEGTDLAAGAPADRPHCPAEVESLVDPTQ